jgi:hypothetical protein
MISGRTGRPAEEDLRTALTAWAFNRESEESDAMTSSSPEFAHVIGVP